MTNQKLLPDQEFEAVFIDPTDDGHCASVEAYIEPLDTTLSADEIVESADIPEDEEARRIDLARRVLLAGGNRTGYSHPVDVRCSLRRCEAVSDEMLRKLAINEIRFGRFRGEHSERLEKANTVLNWADIHIDNGVLGDIESEQFNNIKRKCDSEIDTENKKQEVEAFIQDTPGEVFGATKLDKELPRQIRVAYRTTFHGVDVIAGIIQRRDGKFTAAEWLTDNLLGSDQEPVEVGYNRLLTVADDEHGAFKSLFGHLKRSDQR